MHTLSAPRVHRPSTQFPGTRLSCSQGLRRGTPLLRAALAGLTLTSVPIEIHAATLVWDANNTGAGQTDGAGNWLDANQWWTGTANANWNAGDSAVFGNGGVGGAVALSTFTAADSIVFNRFTGTYTLGTTGTAIFLNSGIVMNGVSGGTATFASPISLVSSQVWANNRYNTDPKAPTGTLAFTGPVDTAGSLLTIDGVGTTSFAASTSGITGTGGLTKNGNGVLILSAALPLPTHDYSGTTTINGGVLRFATTGANATGTGNLTINNGVFEGYFGNSFGRDLGSGAGQIQIRGGVSGFSGQGATASVFTIGTSGSTLQWGSEFFNPSVFVLQASTVNLSGKMTLNNAIDLNGQTRTIASFGGDATGGATVTGALFTSTGTAGLTKIGVGNLILTAANTYNGVTSMLGGTITLSGSGTVNNSSALVFGSGSLNLINTAQVERIADAAPVSSTGGTLALTNTSGSVVYTETLGAVSATSGQFNMVLATNQASTGSQTLRLGSLSRSGTAAITFSAATTGPQAGGNKNMIAVTGAGTTASGIIGPWATVGTAANAQTDYARYSSDFVVPANIAATAESSWTSPTAVYTVNSNTAKAATTLTATREILALRNATTANTITADNTTDLITLAGHAFNDGDPVIFGATAPTGITNGVIYYVVNSNQAAGTFQVATTAGGSVVDFTANGTPNIVGGIRLGTNANLGTTGILHGTAAPLGIVPGSGGVVTLPSAVSANLYITPGSSSIIIAAPVADNGVGVLSLVKSGLQTLILSGNSTYTGQTVINAGTLQLGINGTNNGATLGVGGLHAGGISIAAGATLNIQTNAAQTLSGEISGEGSLVKSYTGTLTLSGANTYTGKTVITPLSTSGAGTLVVSSFNSVATDPLLGTTHTASSSLGAPTTVADGTIDFGSTGIQAGGTLRYVGPGETTDRVINFLLNGNGAGKTLDASGSGLLKFTSKFIGGGSLNNDITLAGTGAGEIVGGLDFYFRNLTKSGVGTWTVNGLVGNTGSTTISGGTLAISGSLMGSTVAVNSSGKLAGSGSVLGAVTVASGGSILPGPGLAALTTGAVTFNAGSTLSLEINSTTQASDLLRTSGNLSLAMTNDSLLALTDLNPSGVSQGTYALLTYTGTWNGGLFSFGGLPVPDNSLIQIAGNSYTFDYDYGGNSVAIIAVPEPAAVCFLIGGIGALALRRRRSSSAAVE